MSMPPVMQRVVTPEQFALLAIFVPRTVLFEVFVNATVPEGVYELTGTAATICAIKEIVLPIVELALGITDIEVGTFDTAKLTAPAELGL